MTRERTTNIQQPTHTAIALFSATIYPTNSAIVVHALVGPVHTYIHTYIHINTFNTISGYISAKIAARLWMCIHEA